MAKVSTSISLDADVKAKAQELFADFGMDLSTAINIFLRQSIRDDCGNGSGRKRRRFIRALR